jgi:hypothetical protein
MFRNHTGCQLKEGKGCCDSKKEKRKKASGLAQMIIFILATLPIRQTWPSAKVPNHATEG